MAAVRPPPPYASARTHTQHTEVAAERRVPRQPTNAFCVDEPARSRTELAHATSVGGGQTHGLEQ